MAATCIFVFFAISITFANKGIIIENEKVNYIFGYLGSISLPIYLFHPIILTLIDYVYKDCPKYAKYLIVYFSALILSFAYRIIANFLNKKIEERNKKIKEEESLKEKKNEENKEEAKEVIQVDVNNHKDDGNSKQALFEEKKIEN